MFYQPLSLYSRYKQLLSKDCERKGEKKFDSFQWKTGFSAGIKKQHWAGIEEEDQTVERTQSQVSGERPAS